MPLDWPANAPLVKRLRDAGAIVLAKANAPQLMATLEQFLEGRADYPGRPPL